MENSEEALNTPQVSEVERPESDGADREDAVRVKYIFGQK